VTDLEIMSHVWRGLLPMEFGDHHFIVEKTNRQQISTVATMATATACFAYMGVSTYTVVAKKFVLWSYDQGSCMH